MTLTRSEEEKLRSALGRFVDAAPMGREYGELDQIRLVPVERPSRRGLLAFAAAFAVGVAVLAPLVLVDSGRGSAPDNGVPAAPSIVTGGGAASGGVEGFGDPHVLAEFEFGIDGDRFGTGEAELEVYLSWTVDDAMCEYSGVSGPPGQVTWADTGSSISVVIDGRIDGPVVGTGDGCNDELFSAELGIFYANGSLDIDSSPVDHDGATCRQLLRSSDSSTATAKVETDDGVIIDATGMVGSASYSREEFICPTDR